MIIQILLLLIGLVFLVKGADWVVDGGSALAKKYHVSDLAIGLTIVAFGTSAPELVVNVVASIENHQEIILGNIIGSNIFNLLAILGIAGLISPMLVQSSTVWKEIPLSFLAVLMTFFLANNFLIAGQKNLSLIDGILLLIVFFGFLFYVYHQLKEEPNHEETQSSMSQLKIWTFIVLGLAGLILGGKLVVDNAVSIAQTLGVSEKMIGLTIVAIGTSLPELVTSVIAALKRKNDIAVGNIIGSNIFNIFGILGVSAIIRPIVYNDKFNFDLYVIGGGTLFLFLAMLIKNKKSIDRWKAALLLLGYVVYTIFLIQSES